MMDQTCSECDRLWEAYQHAAQSHRIIERKSAMDTNLEVMVRRASSRCAEARKALQNHLEMHLPFMKTAGATG